MPELALLRSYLYAPGSSERILSKVLDAGSDAVILDLEDSVAGAAKLEARDRVAQFLADHADDDGRPEMHVRVNRGPHGFDLDDVRAVVRPGLQALRLPKAEDARQVRVLNDMLTHLESERGIEAGTIRIYITIESALGLHQADSLAASPRVARLCFGVADFLADIGARGGHGYRSTLYARSQMVIASRVARIGAPVDNVHTNLDDVDGLRAGAEIARDLGFFGKSVIHPKQLSAVHEVFTPSTDEIAWAKNVVEAFDAAVERGEAALELDGEFIDPAVVARAHGVLKLSSLI